MEKLAHITIFTPIGYLKLVSDRETLKAVSFVQDFGKATAFQPDILERAVIQLREFFSGNRKEFDLELNPEGTEFQKKVWREVSKVKFGETASYITIAKRTGSNKYARAVGLANGKNPIAIIIPCHRIIGSNGKLTGYAGGLTNKKWLLNHEREYANNKTLLF